MIDYRDCKKEEIIEVIESLAYKVLVYQHPGWLNIPEEMIFSLLKEEGLPVIKGAY